MLKFQGFWDMTLCTLVNRHVSEELAAGVIKADLGLFMIDAPCSSEMSGTVYQPA